MLDDVYTTDGPDTFPVFHPAPPLTQGRLSITDDGQVLWKLRSPWRNGTEAFRFDPLVFIERLVAITPHPREHQLTYHGVFAPASSLRHLIVPRPSARAPRTHTATRPPPNTTPAPPPIAGPN
ncbi:MAG: hypothetical protein GY930_14990 [bacterium]|nr:hypothetical protein [bacterium]